MINLTSPSTLKIYRALFDAKQEFLPITKKDWNPHFKAFFAGLPGTLDAIEKAFVKHKILLTFPTNIVEGRLCVLCTLTHIESGEFLQGIFPVVESKLTAQELGSSTTYAKRYSLQALLGVATEDDDAQAVEKSNAKPAVGVNHMGAKVFGSGAALPPITSAPKAQPTPPQGSNFIKKPFLPKALRDERPASA